MLKEIEMLTFKAFLPPSAVAGVILASSAVLAQSIGVMRSDLQRHDLSVTGWETIQSKIDIAPGGVAPKHWHPGDEVIYVLEGKLQYQVAGNPWVTYNAGEVLFIPAGTVHAARNISKKNGAELATYVIEKNKPLLMSVK